MMVHKHKVGLNACSYHWLTFYVHKTPETRKESVVGPLQFSPDQTKPMLSGLIGHHHHHVPARAGSP